jgi:lysyl-tRNA synthetase class I
MLTTVNTLAAFLYLRQEEPMPEPILLEDGEVDIAADDIQLQEWSTRPVTQEYDMDRLERFIARTEQLLSELETVELDPNELSPPQYMTLFYDAAKDVFDHDKQLIRTYFSWLYLVLFQRNEGPRWGEFVAVYGVEEFNEMTRERFSNLL